MSDKGAPEESIVVLTLEIVMGTSGVVELPAFATKASSTSIDLVGRPTVGILYALIYITEEKYGGY
jgi:hypothetical protein